MLITVQVARSTRPRRETPRNSELKNEQKKDGDENDASSRRDKKR